jgi:transposase
MRKTLPVMTEAAETLKHRIPRARDGRKKSRLQRLYWLASGHAHPRQEVAQLLGVPRHTLGHWLAWYAAGGLDALLDRSVPAGKPCRCLQPCWPPLSRRSGAQPALPPMKRCGSGLSRPMAWTSTTTRSIRLSAPSLRPRSRCRGPVTQKNPEAIGEFQATCRERLQHAIPLTNTRPVRVFSQDESRFGLLTIRRRRLTARGVQPVGQIQHVFEWFYVYGAVAPTTGERFFLELPYLNADIFQLFVDAFAQAFPDSLNLLLLDNSGAHTAQRLTLPENVRLVFLPPYCPELNPIERVWRDLKDDLAWQQFPTLEAQQDSVEDWLQAYEALTLQSLTGYAYLVDAINALSP